MQIFNQTNPNEDFIKRNKIEKVMNVYLSKSNGYSDLDERWSNRNWLWDIPRSNDQDCQN